MVLTNYYFRISEAALEYCEENYVNSSGSLGSLMNIWPEANYRADDQLFIGIL